MQTLELPRSFEKVIRWVTSALAKDHSRPTLQHVHYENGVLVTADGFRIHAYRVESESIKGELEKAGSPNLMPRLLGRLAQTSKIIKGEFKQTVWIVDEADPKMLAFPHFEQIFPNPEGQVASVAVNPKYLLDALQNMPMEDYMPMVILRIFGDACPMTVESTTGNAAAVIMPMHSGVVDRNGGSLRKADWSRFGWKAPKPPEEKKEEDHGPEEPQAVPS